MPEEYREHVRAPHWFLLLVAGGVVSTCAVVIWAAWVDREAGAQRWAIVIGTLLGGGALMATVACFTNLRVRVGQGVLRFHFGPFGETVQGTAIVSAEAAPYRWRRFGGWGLRGALPRPWRDRAYSVPFLRESVVVETTGSVRYHLSSHHPQRLVDAIRAISNGRAAGSPAGKQER